MLAPMELPWWRIYADCSFNKHVGYETSTTIMLLPIGLAVITVVKDTVTELSEKQAINFQLALLLGIPYGAPIGGMSTLIGTGPNGMLAGFMLETTT
ncbi:MAG: hypothetical protein Ct9H300mP20_17770 [Gammaproteobacteria bacterium]|nr:MAG: hypothetical protein Ct9H300mP20_17770 [Gammaproteobacteria bacterium]